MREPLLVTEIDEMNRALDPNNTDAPSGASGSVGPVDRLMKNGVRAAAPMNLSAPVEPPAPPRRSASHLAVCPFCGSVNESTAGPCHQCGMENTQATRQATRNKIGPWFVWQARNPSAPGMNWATLLSLVEKGRITPRSVVRGPTTGQLWRFASRVKGLSREFGACWHCGGELHRAARLCGSCKRLQQPPINPDALLETGPDANITPIQKVVADANLRGKLNAPPEAVRREVAPSADASPDESPAAETDLASLPIIDMNDDAMPSGMEFRAYQMDGGAPHRASSRRSVLRRIFIAALLTVLATLPVLYFNPQVRPHYVRWYQQFLTWIKGTSERRIVPPTSASDNETEPGDANPAAPTRLLSVPVTPTPENQTTAIVVEPTAAPATGPAVEIGPARSTLPAADSATQEPVVQIDVTPIEPKAAERRSWELYVRAIKSEQRQDYADAIKEYERIQQLRLPEGVGPSDVDSRLQRAHALQKQQSN